MSLMRAWWLYPTACVIPDDGSSGFEFLLTSYLSLTWTWWLFLTAREFLHPAPLAMSRSRRPRGLIQQQVSFFMVAPPVCFLVLYS